MGKVTAHRDIASAEGSEDRVAFLGNTAADEAAKAGAALHPRPSQAELREASHRWTFLQQLARVAADLISLWPPLRSFLQGRAPRGVPVGSVGTLRRVPKIRVPVEPEDMHRFSVLGGRILCERCLAPVRTWTGARRKVREGPCPGRSEVMWSALTSVDLGHRLAMGIFEGRALCICLRCGFFSAAKVQGLGKPCPGSAGRHQKYALALFRQGNIRTRGKETCVAMHFSV